MLWSDHPPLIEATDSLTSKKQTTKFSSANFQKMFSPSYIILRFQRLEGLGLKPPHQDLCCLQIQLFLSLMLKELPDQTLSESVNSGCNNVPPTLWPWDGSMTKHRTTKHRKETSKKDRKNIEITSKKLRNIENFISIYFTSTILFRYRKHISGILR